MTARALAAVCGMAAVAHAAPPPEAIEVDRDDAPPGRPELGFDGGAPIGDWAVSARLGYLDHPIALRGDTATTAPVARRETLSLGGAIALGDSVVLDAMFPMSRQDGDRLAGFGDDAALSSYVAGDLRVGARLAVSRGIFLRGEATVPTGNDHELAGAPSYTLAWTLIGRAELPAGIIVAATAGIRIRGTEVTIADRLVGDEIAGGAGVIVPLPPIRPLWCARDQVAVTAEIEGAIGDRVASAHGPSPLEARVGLVTHPRGGFEVGVHVGTGLDDEIGAPELRVMVELAWHSGPLVKPPGVTRPVAVDPTDDID